MRGKGEGSVYRRADGYWVGQVEAGRKPDGSRRYARVVRKRKVDVMRALDDLRTKARDGVVEDRNRTLAGFLDWWLDNVQAGQVSAGSLREYRVRAQRIKAHLGQVKLSRLTTTDVQRFSVALSEQYSPKTTRGTMETLRAALRWAVGARMLTFNPAEHVAVARTTVANTDDTLTAEEAAAILKQAEGDELEALWWLALKYGMRIGELVALRWSDIDFGKRELHITQAKTQAGIRTLPLTDEAGRQLQAHRGKQKVVPLDGFLFALDDRQVRKLWTVLLGEAGIEHQCRNCGTAKKCSTSVRRFHASRHTAATLLLEAGVPLEVVSSILGHASIGITAGVYAKVRSDLKRKGLEAIR